MKDLERDIQRASTANEEELESLAYHPSPMVITALIRNRNLTEKLAVIVAARKNVGSDILDALSKDPKWKGSYKVKLALCKNPKSPERVSLALIKSLKIFDMADLTRNPALPVSLKMKVEEGIGERIPALPLGVKITLAKRASSRVLMRLIEEGLKEVVAASLDSPYMTEGDLYKIISMKNISPQVIRVIANHPRWSSRHMIRWALIRNTHAPLACVVNFLKDMKTTDLKELYAAPEVPSYTKPYIFRELLEREEVEVK
ncbi:MAG: hypothetical protein EPN94_10015 [Nitrospirae bacterium]|nr:MAG: hypothetical protein EPN94_10015 [Nitrospirota bacterium]